MTTLTCRCGRKFEPVRPNQLHCRRKCRDEAYNERRREKQKAKPKRRKRAWTMVKFQDLESWRAARNIPKKRMAEKLGVTNSTYHNWARGIAVATPNTQRRIKAVISGHELPSTREVPWNGSGGSVKLTPGVASAAGQIVSAYLGGRRVQAIDLPDLVRSVCDALNG